MDKNYKKVKKVLWVILFANLAVALLKFLIGTTIQSTSLIADAFHSISDGTSNIVGLIGIGLAAKPKDEEHPYGHNKFEVISGLFIGVMLACLGGKIILDALSSFSNPIAPTVTPESLIAIIITVFINIFVCKYEYREGKKLNSYILMSDALHTKSDIFVSLGVLGTLLAIKLGFPPIIDPIASLIVAAFILHASYEIFKSTIDILVDRASMEVEEIAKILDRFPEVKSYHHIRSRGSETHIHVDMHILVDPDMTVEESHDLSHSIEDKIRDITNENSQVIVHFEPYTENNIIKVD